MTDEHAHHHMAGAVAESVDAISALWGGFSSFFSLWFFCLLQVSPFFLAFMAASGASFAGGLGHRLRGALVSALSCSLGYIVIFSLMGSTASSPGMTLFRYNSLMGQLGGIFALLLGAWFLGVLKMPRVSPLWIATVGGILLGSALAFNYRPCATPTLTIIYNLTNDPATVTTGGWYLAVYSGGASIAFLLTGLVISTVLFLPAKDAVFRGGRIAGGILLVIFGILVVTDWMLEYKSFLVGGFV